jgi:hypothetical protein
MKFHPRSIMMPATLLGMGVSALAVTPRFASCSTLGTGRFDLFTWWGGFVGYWILMALGLATLGGVLLVKGRGQENPRVSPQTLAAVVATIGIAFLWFGLLLPYRRPCIGSFLWLYVGWGAAALVVMAILKPVWVARAGMIVGGLLLIMLAGEVVVRVAKIEPRSEAEPNVVQFVEQRLEMSPDPEVGYTHIPGNEFVAIDPREGCTTYEVDIKINNYGFRDVDWELEKPDGTMRIAVIGDSFIEAQHVPLEQTAVKVLEKKLSENGFPPGVTAYETMNFGTRSYSVSLFVPFYTAHIRQFQPDYVFIYVAFNTMRRTFSTLALAGEQNGETFYVLRPTYALDESGELVFEPPKILSAEEFKELHFPVSLDDSVYGKIRKTSKLAAVILPDRFDWPPKLFAKAEEPSENFTLEDSMVYAELNLWIIEELAREVEADGAQLVLIDALGVRYGSPEMIEYTRDFCAANGIGYIDLESTLQTTNEVITNPCDPHFNELGNQLVAEAMFDWLMVEFENLE